MKNDIDRLNSSAICPEYDLEQYRYAPYRRRFRVGFGHTAIKFEAKVVFIVTFRGRQPTVQGIPVFRRLGGFDPILFLFNVGVVRSSSPKLLM